jgi:hypothetical protein
MSTDDPKTAAPPPDKGDKPDLGRQSDRLIDALSGSDLGSDTRAGSLQGGSASGSDDDPDQVVINKALAAEGERRKAASKPETKATPEAD